MTTTCLLRLLPVVSAVFQLLGTAGIIWGLSFTSDTGATYSDGRREISYAGIVRDRPWAFNAGVVLLLLGLALAVVVALR